MKTTTLHLISGLLLLIGALISGSFIFGVLMITFGIFNLIRGFEKVES